MLATLVQSRSSRRSSTQLGHSQEAAKRHVLDSLLRTFDCVDDDSDMLLGYNPFNDTFQGVNATLAHKCAAVLSQPSAKELVRLGEENPVARPYFQEAYSHILEDVPPKELAMVAEAAKEAEEAVLGRLSVPPAALRAWGKRQGKRQGRRCALAASAP